MPAYKLIYFEARGRAEIGRLMFAAAGQDYEDIRYDMKSWPAAKEKTPCGQLPCLSVDGGKMYCQSGPIAVYLASVLGFHGKTPLECLQVNMVVGTVEDLQESMFKLYGVDEKTKDDMLKKIKEENIPKNLKILEKFLTEAGNDYFCLGKMTLADLMVFDTLDKTVEENPSCLDKFPKVKANMSKVRNNPGIKAWLAKRPKTEI